MKALKYRVNDSDVYETLIMAKYEGGDKYNIVTQSNEINEYWELMQDLDKEYVFEELWEHSKGSAIVANCYSKMRTGFTLIYNNKRSILRLSEFDFHRDDLIRCCVFQDYNLPQIMSKYRLIEHENKKTHEITLFNHLLQSEYWLPLEVCNKIGLLITKLMMTDYFYTC